MNIKFTGKYKSITDFEWLEIPKFVVLTGPNGTGKSQLLNLIYNTIVDNPREIERVQFEGETFSRSDVTILQGEWSLRNPLSTDLSIMLTRKNELYQTFREGNYDWDKDMSQIKLFSAFRNIEKKLGKESRQISKQEFDLHFPNYILEQEALLVQKIGELFLDYRLSEIEQKAEGKTEEEVKDEIGEKPWVVLKEILRESKLPFYFNNPSKCGIRDSFQLTFFDELSGEPINLQDLSSGERVLISLVIYLYNSQEKNVFPKLLLLDEPDAHLHPTMSQQFINVMKHTLVEKYGVRVIMTTHSPSTVVLTPSDSLYEMSRSVPKVRKSMSKNHTVSLLTSGLVYVGLNTKYFLVEDTADVEFYTYLNNHLISENKLSGNIPLVFVPASTKRTSGGKDIVQNWVEKIQESGLEDVIHGIIDADSGNEVSKGVFKIKRYSIENYLIDPIITYATLLDKEKEFKVDGLDIKLGEEYKLKSLSDKKLQEIADKIIAMVEPLLGEFFDNYDHVKESERVNVHFTNGHTLLYPEWLIKRRGKTLLNSIYNEVFKSPVVNNSTLFKSLKKINFIPVDIQELFIEVKKVNVDE